MEDKLTFAGGMQPDMDVLSLRPGSYIDALNMIRDNQGNLISEAGITTIHDFGSGAEILGSTVLNDEIILAVKTDSASIIGTINIDDTYTQNISNDILAFIKENKVEMESKIDYQGHRVIYLGGDGIKLRSIDLDNIPTENFDRVTSLFLEYDLPKVSLEGVETGGSVLSGAYQFAARLVTSSGNSTAFGTLTGVIPIGTGSEVDVRRISGAEPQTVTSKIVNLKVSNIDPAFEYIEVCAVTYLGDSNTVSIKSLGLHSIDNNSEVQVSYSGASSETDTVSLEELAIDSTFYSEGKYLTQKDSTLLIGGLKDIQSNTDWQLVANSIVLKPVTHKVKASETIDVQNPDVISWNDLPDEDKIEYAASESKDYGTTWIDEGSISDYENYRNPKTCEKFVGYRRDEVYSFTFTPIFTGGRKGDAYHIPAMSSLEYFAKLLPLGSEYIGTLGDGLGMVTTATSTYPEDYPEYAGQNIRYHKMPSNKDFPCFTEENRQTIINEAGEEYPLPGSGQQYINILGVRAIITYQGDWKSEIVGYIIGRENRVGKETILSQGFVRELSGSGKDNDKYSPMPGIGLTHYQKNSNTGDIASWTVKRESGSDFDSAWILNPKLGVSNVLFMHSPDFIISKNLSGVPSSIRRVSRSALRYEYAATGQREGTDGIVKTLTSMHPGTYAEGVDIPLNSAGLTFIPAQSTDPTDDNTNYSGGASDDGVNINLSLFGVPVEFSRTSEAAAIQTTERIDVDETNIGGSVTQDTPRTYKLEAYKNSPTRGNYQNMHLDVYNLVVERDEYYGSLYDKKALPTKLVLFSEGSIDDRTEETLEDFDSICFGGDTFVSRCSVCVKYTSALYERKPIKTDETVYLMVESNNNFHYRHYNEEVEGSTAASVPYYPKSKILQNDSTGINEIYSVLGSANLYNKQYSAQNNLKTSYTKTLGALDISTFDNRIIYSATSIEGEKFDAYKLFSIADYHDIPKQFGKISGLFVQGSDLYVHTERSLWRAFYNTLAKEVTTAGEVVLGNGGAFSRPSIPILTVDGGYAGCKDISASVSTPSGRYFMDSFRAKLYYLGETLKEISNPTVFDLLRDNEYGSNLILGYDYGRKRVLISGTNLTLSFRPELNSFESRHSYKFDVSVTRDIGDYVAYQGKVGKFDVNKVREYFDIRYNSSIKTASIVQPTLSKRFTSMYAIVHSVDPITKRHMPNVFFDKIRVYSYIRNTDWNSLNMVTSYLEDLETVGNVNVYNANNKYRLGIPPDVVNNIDDDIFNATNLKTHVNYSDSDREFLPDVIDDHAVIEFVCDNATNKILKVSCFIVNFEQNIT